MHIHKENGMVTTKMLTMINTEHWLCVFLCVELEIEPMTVWCVVGKYSINELHLGLRLPIDLYFCLHLWINTPHPEIKSLFLKCVNCTWATEPSMAMPVILACRMLRYKDYGVWGQSGLYREDHNRQSSLPRLCFRKQKNTNTQGWKMPEWLRAFFALAENMGSIPSIYIVANHHL